jgi:hypothetical protein
LKPIVQVECVETGAKYRNRCDLRESLYRCESSEQFGILYWQDVPSRQG